MELAPCGYKIGLLQMCSWSRECVSITPFIGRRGGRPAFYSLIILGLDYMRPNGLAKSPGWIQTGH
jgi:hypothetical protein